MIATLEYIERKFAEYNSLMFQGKLKPLPVRLSRARSFLGQIAYKRRRTLFGKWKYESFEFRISILIDMPEELLEDTILHEMIHYYILSNQIDDTSAHGKVFRTMMNDINQRYGRHITISHRRTDQEKASDTQRRRHIVCAVRFTDDTYGLAVPADTRLFQFWDAIMITPRIAEYKWYLTHNPYFNRYPRCRTLKTYRITKVELNGNLADAKPLMRSNNRVMVEKSKV